MKLDARKKWPEFTTCHPGRISPFLLYSLHSVSILLSQISGFFVNRSFYVLWILRVRNNVMFFFCVLPLQLHRTLLVTNRHCDRYQSTRVRVEAYFAYTKLGFVSKESPRADWLCWLDCSGSKCFIRYSIWINCLQRAMLWLRDSLWFQYLYSIVKYGNGNHVTKMLCFLIYADIFSVQILAKYQL